MVGGPMPVQVQRVSVMPLDVQIWVTRTPACTVLYIVDALAAELGEAGLARLCAAIADAL
ncbi:hypothetical protein GCM10017750_58390 [Streptomyces racemochromogenes]